MSTFGSFSTTIKCFSAIAEELKAVAAKRSKNMGSGADPRRLSPTGFGCGKPCGDFLHLFSKNNAFSGIF